MISNKDNIFSEIGGNFWLHPNQWHQKSKYLSKTIFAKENTEVSYTSSGRGAIRLLLKQFKNKSKTVLLPYFTCDSVIEPFFDNGFEIFYYSIETDLTVDINKLDLLIKKHNPSILYLQSYFGFDTLKGIDEYIKDVKKIKEICVVEDITHSLLSDFSYRNVDFYVGSLRKWLEIPDGGILIANNSLIDNSFVKKCEPSIIVDLFIEASKLKYNYTLNLDPQTKEKFRKLYYSSEDILNSQKEVFSISQISKYVLSTTDFIKIKEKRIRNYNFLFQKLVDCEFINVVLPKASQDTVPLYLCIDSKGNREIIQKKLAKMQIYAPIIWPKSDFLKTTYCENENFFYKNLLSIPCDQRYDLNDLEAIIKIFNG